MPVALNAQQFGDGPPLIVLHGLFGSARNWTSIARRLGERNRVFTLDLRNHGESPWDDDMSYGSMAGDVAAFMDRKGLDRAALLGHSMGGKVAMTLALEEGERVDSLIVVDIVPVTYDSGHEAFIRAMAAVDLGAVTRRGEVDTLLRDAVSEPGIRAFLLQNLVTRPEGLAWRINLKALDAEMAVISDFRDDLLSRSYDGPALFLAGAHSDYVSPGHEPLIRRIFPNADIEVIADANHWVHADQPDRFVAAVGSFLG